MGCCCLNYTRFAKDIKPTIGQDALDRIDEYLKLQSSELALTFSTFWEDQQKALPFKPLRESIASGILDEQTAQAWLGDYTRLVDATLRQKWVDAIEAAAAEIIHQPGYVFDPMAESIQRWISEHGAQLVTNMSNQQREVIAELVQRAYASEMTGGELSRVIRPCIGLTKPQARANLNYYNHMKQTLLQDHPRLSADTAAQRACEAAAKYAAKQRGKRSYDISITELSFAYNQGAHDAIKQAQDQGLMGKMVKRWSTAASDGMCEICSTLGQADPVDIDADFDYGGMPYKLPPAHPRCRCAVAYEEIRTEILV